MHLRRALLLFALVLGLAALAAAVSPTREDPAPSAAPVAAAPPTPIVARSVVFESLPKGKPRLQRARTGEHLLLMVASVESGLATVPKLGRTASVSPASPAQFDVLAPQAGRYDVMFEPTGAVEPRRVGTLVTRP
jgi:hypothetical protein